MVADKAGFGMTKESVLAQTAPRPEGVGRLSGKVA
jgi:hypothetical protein